MNRCLLIAFTLVLCAASIGIPPSSAAPQPWQLLDGPTGGSVAAMVMSPDYANDRTAFAGLRGRGVYRSIDGGATWQPSGLSDQVIVDLAISPAYATDHTLFAAEGLSPAGFNIYRSTDSGATWQTPFVTPYSYGFKPLIGLNISPGFASDHTLYALNGAETYKSSDGGLVYSKAGGWFASHTITNLVLSPGYSVDHTIFAAVQDDQLFKSADGGAHWNPAGLGGDVMALALSPNYPGDHTLAVVVRAPNASGSVGHLRVSHDDGASWNDNTPWPLDYPGQTRLLFSPTFVHDQLILASSSGRAGLFRSTDGGQTWALIDQAGLANKSIFALALAPDTAPNPNAFLGTSSGFYRSFDRGASWHPDNNGLPHLTIRRIAIAPNDPNRVLVATSYFQQQRAAGSVPVESDSNLQLSVDGGQTWRDVSGRIDQVQQMDFSPDVANDQIALACVGVIDQQGYKQGGIYRSIDAGASWEFVYSSSLCTTLALSPNFAADHMAWAYFSAGTLDTGIFRSVDGGATWTMLTNAIAANLIAPSSNYAINQTLFAATQDGRLQKSIDGGLHWTPVLNHPLTAFAVSPAYGASQTLYAAAKDSDSVPADLYRSLDGGATWQKLITGIPPASSGQNLTIASLDFAADGSVIVGVTYGSSGAAVYRSVDGGQTWQLIGTGLEQFNLFDVASTSNSIEGNLHGALSFYAGTSGGLWRIDQSQRDPTEPGAWDSSGPRGGRADVLAVSPNFAKDGVALTAEWNRLSHTVIEQYGSGILKSADWGQTWQSAKMGPINPPFYSSAVHGYAFSPNFATDQTAFAATWGGLFKSTDGGQNWQWLNPGVPNTQVNFVAVAVAPNYSTSGQVLAAGNYACVYRSQDFGANWSEDCSVGSDIIAYSPNFAADQTIFIGGYKNGYKSINSGMSWTPVLTLSVTALAISPQFGSDQTLFAGGPDGLVKSTNGGATWISATIGLSSPAVNALAISPAFATDHVLFAATNAGLYRSNDSGVTWNQATALGSSPVSSLAISPGWPAHPYLLAGTAQGVYRTTDGGQTWVRMPGLSPLGAGAVALSADEGLWLTSSFNGLQASTDHGHAWFSFGLENWATSHLAISPAYATDHTIFAAATCHGCTLGGSIQRTTDNSTTWQSVYSEDGISSIAISPQYAADRTIYAISYGSSVVRSTDGGDHWSRVGTWLAGRATQQVALPPNYPTDTIVFAAGPGFWRLLPGETTWQPAASGILSTFDVNALVIAPNYPTSHTLLAVTSQLLGDDRRSYSVFRSDDGGVNWQPSDIGVPTAEWRSLAFSPNYATDHTVYLVSATQLYRSIDDGHRWTAISAPPGWPELNSVAVSRSGQVIVASSAGVWRYSTKYRDILIDGDFEVGSGWEFIATADETENVALSGRQALRLGIDNGSNTAIDSAAVQTVTIPISVTQAKLNLRVYPVTSETQVMPHNQAMLPNAAVGDVQYATLTVSGTTPISRTLFRTLSNAQAWQSYSFDLTPYAGQTIVLRLGVINDGHGGQTAMYVDNAGLIIGPGGTRVYLPMILKNYAH